jgi:protein O-mannosyl-transferase
MGLQLNPKTNWTAENWKQIFLLVLCIGIVYGQTLFFNFINYDDDRMVYNNSSFLGRLDNIPKSFTQHVFATQGEKGIFYRPLLLVSYIYDYQIWKLNPFGYHLTNLLLHVLVSLLVYLFISKIVKAKFYSFIGALIFALHPVQTQPVAWVAGRNDLLLGLFGISTFLFYYYFRAEKKKYLFALSILFFVAALATKEQGIFLIFAPLLYEIFFSGLKFKDYSKPLFLRTVAYGIMIACYFLVRYFVFGAVFNGNKYYSVDPMLQRIVSLPAVIGTYLQLVVFPVNLNLVHDVPSVSSILNYSYVVGLIFFFTIIIFFFRFRKRYPVTVFGLSWLALFILPSSNIIPLPVPVLEHRLYLPMIGFAIFVSGGLYKLKSFSITKNIITYISILIVIIYSLVSFFRVPVWKNTETIWTNSIVANPDNDLPYYNLGTFYLSKAKYMKGIENLEKAAQVNNQKPDTYQNLGYAYFQIGKFEEAVRVYNQALQLDTTAEPAYLGLANARRELKNFTEAARVYKNGLTVNANSVSLHYELGLVYGLLKEDSLAEVELKKAVSLDEKYAPAYFSLGALYAYKKDDSLAIVNINEGMKYQLPSPDVYNILSKSYANIGDTIQEMQYWNLYRQTKR